MIDTTYIKKHVACWACESKNLVRRSKQTVKNTVNPQGELVDTKLSWRAFQCKDCDEYTHTMDDKTTLEFGECIPLPFTCFRYMLEGYQDDYLSLSLFLVDKIASVGSIAEDDLRDEHVRYLMPYFKAHGMTLANSAENVWEVCFDPALNISSVKEGEELLRKTIKATGAKWWKEQEQIMREDDDYVPEWVDKMWDDEQWKEPANAIF